MKNLVFLYAGNDGSYAFDRVFFNKSAFGRTLDWAKAIPDCSGIVVFTTNANSSKIQSELIDAALDDVKVIIKEKWLCRDIIETMSNEVSSVKAENAIFTSGDRPFLDSYLTNEVLECHEKYIAEYTFADGYPYGFAPEVIHSGTLNILSAFVKEKYQDAGLSEVGNECIFNVLKKDINSFEVEAVLAPKDYRMLRFDFSCGTKRNFLACQRLLKKASEKQVMMNAKSLSDLAEVSADIQQTLPAFYNVQICSEQNAVPIYSSYKNPGLGNMDIDGFSKIVAQIAEFSDDAVVGLSAFGEPLLMENVELYVAEVLKHDNLSVLIETDGILVTTELAERISEQSKSRVIWIVSIDSATAAMYSKVLSNGCFEKAVQSVSILSPLFPGNVYPQFTRMNENEIELEAFYRYWHDSASPSNGKLIVQKYDDCCKTLPARKPADLSPLERNVCWHLKRDMTILSNGDVPLCRQFAFSSVIGNVFDEGIEKIWGKTLATVEKHIANEYGEKCRNCDEYYTFNF
ncbi:spiro-SPASM protein [Treponema sp.]|uniref:spiro-SPASM protein n=1 Tax=Treponema sp. TaxID=166 RepID=UPI003890057D